MSARKFLRVELVPNPSSHLVCISCLRCNCDFAIASGSEPETGIHKKCISNVKAKRGVK